MKFKLKWKCNYCDNGFRRIYYSGKVVECFHCQGNGRGIMIIDQELGKLSDEKISQLIVEKDIYGDH